MCVVRCHPKLRSRIRKAVSKEKWMDQEWKDSGFTRVLCAYTDEGIEFKLKDFRHLNVAMAYSRAITIAGGA